MVVAGCTTQQARDHGAVNANAAGLDVQCHSEQRTGSAFGKTVCTTQAERDAQRAAAADLKRAAAAQGGGCRSSSELGCQ
jgi:hypothetical protein